MKIKTETADLIMLAEKAIWQYFLAAIFVLVGLVGIVSPSLFTENMEWWVGLIFIAIGIFVVFFAKSTTATFDKNQNKLLFVTKSLTGKKAEEYNLDQIREIVIRQSYETTTSTSDEGGTTQPRYSYRLSLVLAEGKEIGLGSSSSTPTEKREIGKKIADFLNVSFNEG